MKISVITVCFNAAEHIDETLRSVVMQDHGPVEHIVIDGGSTDGTLERIGRYREVIAHFVTEPDKGVYDAMNKGLRLATGEVIAFVNAGDMIAHRSCLSEMAAEFAKGDADAIYGDAYMVDPKDIRKVKRFWKGGVYKREAFRSGWMQMCIRDRHRPWRIRRPFRSDSCGGRSYHRRSRRRSLRLWLAEGPCSWRRTHPCPAR